EQRGAMSAAWVECPHDGERINRAALDDHFLVCPRCGHHHRLGARERLRLLTDPGTFEELTQTPRPLDPLRFVDTKPYAERLRAARIASGEAEAVVWGTAAISGQPAVVVVMDFGFIGGSMGSAVGQVVAHAVETAVASRLP